MRLAQPQVFQQFLNPNSGLLLFSLKGVFQAGNAISYRKHDRGISDDTGKASKLGNGGRAIGGKSCGGDDRVSGGGDRAAEYE